MKLVYMDHSATTPVDQEVFNTIKPYYTDVFYNPSSAYSPAQKVRKAVEKAREQVALLINALPEEIIFTSGGTEADNQAIISYAITNMEKGRHIITSAIEHHAVLDSCKYLINNGFECTVIPVNSLGVVEPETLEKAIRPDTILISIMHGNNEIGSIQPIKELAEIARKNQIAFHTDAVQTMGKISLDVKALGINMLSGSSHKFYGPKGTGFLYLKKGTRIGRLLHGGSQERKHRAGTENVPGIVGLGKACELAGERLPEQVERLTKLGKRLTDGILTTIPNTRLTGHPVDRIPGSVSVCFEFVEGESILLMLDQLGIMASSGSACTSGSLDPSHVLLAIGLPAEIAHGSLRLTLGKDSTVEDVDYVLQVLPPIIERLRQMSPLVR